MFNQKTGGPTKRATEKLTNTNKIFSIQWKLDYYIVQNLSILKKERKN